MAQPIESYPVLLIVVQFSRHAAALEWATQKLEAEYGEVEMASPCYDFVQTEYYQTSMGTGLKKQLLAFREIILADRLAEIKRYTNQLEAEFALIGMATEPRPLNLDPGILNLGKFHLATTKDQAHRVYLRDGIFAEVTLRFQDGAYEPWPWTYADYRLPEVRSFLKEARDYYKSCLRRRDGAA